MGTFLHILVIVSAFGGFLLAFYIWYKKQAHEKMVCPLDSDCDAVIYSEYAKLFGVPIEILGLLYYGIVAVSYAVFLAIPSIVSAPFVFGILGLTTAAFLFSLYLTFIQAFNLRQWCTWCLMSAGLCAVIFASAVIGSQFSFLPFLAEHHDALVILHFLGVVLGFGGATIADIFFFKFLKDFRISEWEAKVMHTLSQIIWFALAILVLTGLGLYLPEAQELNQTPKFLVKMIVVLTLIVNGAFLNLLVSPKLVKMFSGQKQQHEAVKLHRIRKIAFALGAISSASWYSAFLLGALRNIDVGFLPLLFIYLGIVALGVIASQFMERSFVRRANSS